MRGSGPDVIVKIAQDQLKQQKKQTEEAKKANDKPTVELVAGDVGP